MISEKLAGPLVMKGGMMSNLGSFAHVIPQGSNMGTILYNIIIIDQKDGTQWTFGKFSNTQYGVVVNTGVLTGWRRGQTGAS